MYIIAYAFIFFNNNPTKKPKSLVIQLKRA